jgi:hypothetical protein
MMRSTPWLVSIGLIVVGVFFCYHSEDYSRTRYSYLYTGMLCIALGSIFSFLIWFRDTGPPLKGGPKHPLE